MSLKAKQSVLASAIVLIIIIADQAMKLWVHSSFYLGESFKITEWFSLVYIENDGIAFGIELFDKLILTLFRIVVSGALIWYIAHRIRRGESTLFITCLALILAGATGNIIDCVFYGKVFGYAPYFYGRVIDMLSFSFFPPVFNIADSAITVGVFLMLIFSKKLFKEDGK